MTYQTQLPYKKRATFYTTNGANFEGVLEGEWNIQPFGLMLLVRLIKGGPIATLRADQIVGWVPSWNANDPEPGAEVLNNQFESAVSALTAHAHGFLTTNPHACPSCGVSTFGAKPDTLALVDRKFYHIDCIRVRGSSDQMVHCPEKTPCAECDEKCDVRGDDYNGMTKAMKATPIVPIADSFKLPNVRCAVCLKPVEDPQADYPQDASDQNEAWKKCECGLVYHDRCIKEPWPNGVCWKCEMLKTPPKKPEPMGLICELCHGDFKQNDGEITWGSFVCWQCIAKAVKEFGSGWPSKAPGGCYANGKPDPREKKAMPFLGDDCDEVFRNNNEPERTSKCELPKGHPGSHRNGDFLWR